MKRDLLEHVIVLDEPHLRRLLCDYVKYYNEDRVHTIIRDSPNGQVDADSDPLHAPVSWANHDSAVSHHFYEWREAA